MKTKYVLQYAEPYEYPALEAYLHQMSTQGWQLDHVFPHALRFVKREEVNYYAILLQPEFSSDNPYDKTKDTKKMSEFLEEFQLQYVCGFTNMQVFSSSKPCTPYTEPDLQKKLVEKVSRRSFQNTIFIIVLVMVFLLLSFLVDPHRETLKYNLLANRNSWFLMFLYICLWGYFFCLYLPYRKFKKTGQYKTDPAIFHTKRLLRNCFPFLALILTGLFTNSYLFFLFIIMAFLLQIVGIYFPSFHKAIYIFSVVGITLLYQTDERKTFFQIVKQTPNDAYQEVLNILALPNDRYRLISSPLMSMESVKIEEYPVLIHYTIKDSFLKNWLLDSLSKDYGIDFTEDTNYIQTYGEPVTAQDEVSLRDSIYIAEKLSNTHPMLIVSIGKHELWLIPGTYTDEQAKGIVSLLQLLP